jgi:hypothetical protein
MPQAIIPLFTEDTTLINYRIGVRKVNGTVYYVQGGMPFYCHMENSRNSFKHIVCQMLVNDMATRSEIARAFKIPERSISRWRKLFEENGKGYFFSKP